MGEEEWDDKKTESKVGNSEVCDQSHHVANSMSHGVPTTVLQLPPVANLTKTTSFKRRVRGCGKCDVCLQNDCGECRHCQDKKKYGGLDKIRQKCIMRKNCSAIRQVKQQPHVHVREATRLDLFNESGEIDQGNMDLTQGFDSKAQPRLSLKSSHGPEERDSFYRWHSDRKITWHASLQKQKEKKQEWGDQPGNHMDCGRPKRLPNRVQSEEIFNVEPT